MRYQDRVYGEVEISEPVILDIINSSAIQRLKGVDQAGYRPLWVKPDADVGEYDYSRFAHSLGVYLLLRKFGAPLEEQIAGLIHDVSHSAFSHCIEYVVKEGSERENTYQDNIFNNFVKKTEIPGILEKYGFNLEYILDDANFPLKEKKLPDLCADRIDYSLRVAVIFEGINQNGAKYFLDNFSIINKKWAFKNFEVAKQYADLFLKINTVYFSDFPSAIMYRTVGDYVKYALDKKYISKDDLYTTDKIVLEKIGGHLRGDKKLKLLFGRMNKKIKCQNNLREYDAKVYCKSRAVNPLCLSKGGLQRVSDIDKNFDIILKRELEPKVYFLKFEK